MKKIKIIRKEVGIQYVNTVGDIVLEEKKSSDFKKGAKNITRRITK